jgi:hypothetical protein
MARPDIDFVLLPVKPEQVRFRDIAFRISRSSDGQNHADLIGTNRNDPRFTYKIKDFAVGTAGQLLQKWLQVLHDEFLARGGSVKIPEESSIYSQLQANPQSLPMLVDKIYFENGTYVIYVRNLFSGALAVYLFDEKFAPVWNEKDALVFINPTRYQSKLFTFQKKSSVQDQIKKLPGLRSASKDVFEVLFPK